MISSNNNNPNYEFNAIDRRRDEVSKRIASLQQRLGNKQQQQVSMREPLYDNVKVYNTTGISKQPYQRRVVPTYDQAPLKLIKNNNNNIGNVRTGATEGQKYQPSTITPPTNTSEIQKLHNLVKATIQGQTAIQRELSDLRIQMQHNQKQDQQNNNYGLRQKQKYRELSPKRSKEHAQQQTTPVDKLSSNYQREKQKNIGIIQTAPFNPAQNPQQNKPHYLEKQSYTYVPQRIMNVNDKEGDIRRKNTLDLPKSTTPYQQQPQRKNTRSYLENRRSSQNVPPVIVEKKLEEQNILNKKIAGKIVGGRQGTSNAYSFTFKNPDNKRLDVQQIPARRQRDKILEENSYDHQNQQKQPIQYDINYRVSQKSLEKQESQEQQKYIKKNQSNSNSKEAMKKIPKKQSKQSQQQKISRSRQESPTKYDFLRQYEYLKNSEERAAKSQSQYDSKRNRGGTASQQMKISISKKIKIRLRESQQNYKDSSHKNAKHQHHHLLNTFQLQKKLREDMIRRVHEMQDVKRYK